MPSEQIARWSISMDGDGEEALVRDDGHGEWCLFSEAERMVREAVHNERMNTPGLTEYVADKVREETERCAKLLCMWCREGVATVYCPDRGELHQIVTQHDSRVYEFECKAAAICARETRTVKESPTEANVTHEQARRAVRDMKNETE